MGRIQTVLISSLAVCGLGGIMAVTNPNRSAYEVYATEQLVDLAINQCDRAPEGVRALLQGPCRAVIASIKPQLGPMLAAATIRQNFILFSIYRSNISIPAANLNAQMESIGAFNHFFTYKTP